MSFFLRDHNGNKAVQQEKALQASKSIQSKCDIALTFLKWFFVFTFKIETDY